MSIKGEIKLIHFHPPGHFLIVTGQVTKYMHFLSYQRRVFLVTGFNYPCICLAKGGWSQRNIDSSSMLPKVSFPKMMAPPIPQYYLHCYKSVSQLILIALTKRKQFALHILSRCSPYQKACTNTD